MKQKHMDQGLSRTFSVGGVIAIFLIVAIHYHSKKYIDVTEGFGLNYLFQEWITNSIARFAVPFFAATSGFFYFLKFYNICCYLPQTKKRLFTLLTPYLISITIILLHDITLHIVKYHHIPLEKFDFIWNLMHPDSVQLWFLRDLIIIAIFLSPAIYLAINWLPRLTILILSIIWFFEIQIFPIFFGWYFVNIETLLFFSVGGYFAKNMEIFKRYLAITERYFFTIFFLFILLSLTRVLIAPDFRVWYGVEGGGTVALSFYKLTIIFGLFSFMPTAKRLNSNKLLLISSPFSFFLFLYHIKPTSTISINLGSLFVADEYLFYIATPLTIIITLFAGWSIARLAPTIYAVISGGR